MKNRISLQDLASLRALVTRELVASLSPFIVESGTQIRDIGKIVSLSSQKGLVPVSIKDSLLPPVYGATLDGLVYSGYGNATLRKWADVCLEDLVRIQDLIEAKTPETATLAEACM